MAIDTNASLRRSVIYELYVRSHTPEGTFRAVEPDLDRIRALGTDIVWFMPIHPIGVLNKKGSLGCPYANRDYRTVNPEYGTMEDFIHLVDEIHRLNRAVEEILYPAMEDFAIDIIVGKGPSANSIRLDLPRFTLIGATTRAGQLSSPLRDRFGVQLRLELYTTEELQRIVMRSAALLGIEIDPAGAREIASRSRGTPRIANRLLRRVRDFAQVCHDGVITTEAADHALGKLEVDKLGLDAIDRRMLTAIIRSYGGGPVGLETLAATIGEEAVTLEDVYEPYLLQIGFLTRTPRGRCVTPLAYEHLHLPAPVPDAGGQLSF